MRWLASLMVCVALAGCVPQDLVDTIMTTLCERYPSVCDDVFEDGE